ncbi:MAG TPA: protein kinase [Kofleriaceae bacterium]
MAPNDKDREDPTLVTPGDPRDATPTVGSPAKRSIRPAGPLKPGNRYAIGEVIARGGMGEVVHAVDEQIGRPVAIKRMIDGAPNDVDIERFLREARIQGRLDHPAIVPVYELARDVDGRPFFAMKRLSGRTLDDVLEAHDNHDPVALARFPRQRLLRAFADVCLAMEFAHEHGVVHRDLKPTNIMLGDFGEVYVLDWGIARIAGETEPIAARAVTAAEGGTQPGTRLGTPGYMSPEQIESHADLDGRADVYSLGCILFEILTGKSLHPPGPPGMISATEGRDARPSQYVPERDIAPELEQLCVEATMRDRDERLHSARELGDRVQDFLDGDRDLVQRQKLAREHLARANQALTAPNVDADRTAAAMREAGRALVLDPTVVEAADLVRRVMAEAPSITPPEVQREIIDADALAHRQFARLSMVAYFAYLGFVPILLWLGVRDYFYLYAMLGVIGANGIIAWLGTRGWMSPVRSVLVVLVHGTMAALLTRMFGLVIVAPGAVAVTLMALVPHPLYAKPWRAIVAVAFVILAMLAPFLAELAGILSPRTVEIVGETVVIHPLAVHQVPGLIEMTFVLWTATLVAIASGMAWVNARRERANRHLLRVQAWRLRQLAPEMPAAANRT